MQPRSQIIDFFDGMLSKKEFFIPLTAAQYQFPNHYYGLTSAALLEDLFVDAAINYQKMERRDVHIERPERITVDDVTNAKGEKGWDYKFQSEHYSHKVGKDVGGIALLWDSTFKLPPDGKYSYPSPIIFVLSQYKGKNGRVSLESSEIDLTPLIHYRKKEILKGQSIVICEKLEDMKWRVLQSFEVEQDEVSLHDFLKFDSLWGQLLELWSGGIAVNKIDIFVTKARKSSAIHHLAEGMPIDVNFVALPGIYLFPKVELQNVEVEKNNRGVILPKDKVLELVANAQKTLEFSFLPTWYTAYAGSRNVDLYQAQRAEYDSIITAAKH